MEKISILSQVSVDKLRIAVKKDKAQILNLNFNDLCDEYKLSLIKSHTNFDESINLVMPDGVTQETNNDKENCIRIGKILPKLSIADATDERLWVTLSLREFKEYAQKRWVKKKEKVPMENHILNHWFASGIRGRMRDNAIGRLWWYQNLCNRLPGRTLDESLDVLFADSDFRSQILERNQSSSVPSVVKIILEITEERNKIEGAQKNQRNNFRPFMKSVNLLAGRSVLAAMPYDYLKEQLEKLYREAYKI